MQTTFRFCCSCNIRVEARIKSDDARILAWAEDYVDKMRRACLADGHREISKFRWRLNKLIRG